MHDKRDTLEDVNTRALGLLHAAERGHVLAQMGATGKAPWAASTLQAVAEASRAILTDAANEVISLFDEFRAQAEVPIVHHQLQREDPFGGRPWHHLMELNLRQGVPKDFWMEPLEWHRKAEHTGQRQRVLLRAEPVDMFDHDVPASFWLAMLHLMLHTQHLDWMFLTRQPQNVLARIGEAIKKIDLSGFPSRAQLPWPNFHLGVSVANQAEADERVAQLLSVPACSHFLFAQAGARDIDLTSIEWPELAGHRVDVLRGGYWIVPDDGASSLNAEPLCQYVAHSSFPATIKLVAYDADRANGHELDKISDTCITAGVPIYPVNQAAQLRGEASHGS